MPPLYLLLLWISLRFKDNFLHHMWWSQLSRAYTKLVSIVVLSLLVQTDFFWLRNITSTYKNITFPLYVGNKAHLLYVTSSPSIFGSTFSSGTSTSSMTIWPVVEALKENFPSILGAESPFIPFWKQTTTETMTELNSLGRCNSNLNYSQVSSLKEAINLKAGSCGLH